MATYKFKFEMKTESCSMKGEGVCRAADGLEAIKVARRGVADQMNCRPRDVHVLSVIETKIRKKSGD